MTFKINDETLVNHCLHGRTGGEASCVKHRYVIENIPAFAEEKYMTAKTNFLSAIRYELSEIRYFDGRVDKVTKRWSDVNEELRRDDKFGLQIKRGKDIVDSHIEAVTMGETDPLKKAKAIYNFIKGHYRWNDYYGKYSDLGIKKAFDAKIGNVADINLSLIAALRYAEIDVEPVLLSTRDNGAPTTLFPVMSEFNYVIAKANIGGTSYLLDATEDIYPFGMIPERCLNGRGRAIGRDTLYWVDLKPSQRNRQVTMLSAELKPDGNVYCDLSTTYYGYAAVDARSRLISMTEKGYFNNLASRFPGMEMTNTSVENLDDVEKPLIQKIVFKVDCISPGQSQGFFNPNFIDRWMENPFRSDERLFPVDFGWILDQSLIFTLKYPEEFEIVNVPEKRALGLPANGEDLL